MECGSLGGVCSLVIGVRIGIIALLRLSVYRVSGTDSLARIGGLGIVRGLDGSGLVNQLFRHCGFDRFRLGHLTGRLDLQAFRSVVGVMFPAQSEGDEILRGGHIEDVQCSGRAYADQFRRGIGSGSGIVALIALVLVFILNMLNVKMFGEAEFWFALIKVAAIVSFMVVAIVAIVLGLHTGTDPDGGAITAGAHNILGNGGFFPEGFPIVFALTLGVVFAFGGTEMVGVAAGEAKDAEKILPKAINSMILRIFVFYVGSVMLLALVLPYTSYSKTESPFVTFFSGIGVPYAGDIIQVVVLTAALSSLNAGLYATGRTLRSMAVAGEAPRVAAGLNKHQVPAGGIIITSALGLLGVVLNAYLPGDAFDIVMNLAGIGIAGTWGAILVTHLAFLRRVQEGKEVRPAYRMPWAPWSNYAALAFFTIVVVSNVADPAGRWTLALFAVVAVMMVAGWYAVRGRIRGDLLDDVLADEVDEAASAPSHEA